MKKRALAMIFAAFIAMSLVGCGSTADTNTSDTSNDVGSAVVEETTDEPDDDTVDSDYYFKDNILQTKDVKIEITDYKIIPVGEEGNEYGEKPVIAFWYNTTNLTGNEDVNPMSAWIAMFTCIQDNNPNAINELEVGMLPDDRFLDSQMETIKKDGTVENAMSYELDDLETPVTLKATRGVGGEELGEQTFEIK
ncbi:DUF5067 domain-containing protein [Butyricicoccus sp.]|uniref:DUF5067 domain-containing protein n=1 Tax=Butyricicoccus sp. TaxID=2049021 RepID=UPI003F16B8F2